MRIIFILLLSLPSLTSCAQTEEYSGEYYYETGGQKYHLTLNSDGTFLFSQYWKGMGGLDSSGSEHGKGKWTYKNGIVRFFSEPELDIDQKHRLNFNNSAAKIESKSYLVFFQSEIFWLENLRMVKRT